jgi:hypothetical protein
MFRVQPLATRSTSGRRPAKRKPAGGRCFACSRGCPCHLAGRSLRASCPALTRCRLRSRHPAFACRQRRLDDTGNPWRNRRSSRKQTRRQIPLGLRRLTRCSPKRRATQPPYGRPRSPAGATARFMRAGSHEAKPAGAMDGLPSRRQIPLGLRRLTRCSPKRRASQPPCGRPRSPGGATARFMRAGSHEAKPAGAMDGLPSRLRIPAGLRRLTRCSPKRRASQPPSRRPRSPGGATACFMRAGSHEAKPAGAMDGPAGREVNA